MHDCIHKPVGKKYVQIHQRILINCFFFYVQRNSLCPFFCNLGTSYPHGAVHSTRSRFSSQDDPSPFRYSWKIFRQTVFPKMVKGKTKFPPSEIRANLARMAEQNIESFFALLSSARYNETHSTSNAITSGSPGNSVLLLPLLASRGWYLTF